MKQNKIKKIQIVENIKKLSNDSIMTILIRFNKTKSIELKEIRQKFTQNNIKIKLIKNTLAKKAIKNTNNEVLLNKIAEQKLIIFSNKIKLPISILKNINKKNNNIKIDSFCLYGKLYKSNKADEILSMPNYDEGLIKLILLLKLPVIKLTQTLRNPYLTLLILLNKIQKNKKN